MIAEGYIYCIPTQPIPAILNSSFTYPHGAKLREEGLITPSGTFN